MLPDINMVIRRDQKRTFTDDYLRPMRGSSHQFMIFGMPSEYNPGSCSFGFRSAVLRAFEFLRIDVLCPVSPGIRR